MEQLELFNFPTFKITKPIRLIELFAGVGSQAMALRNIGANFEHYRVCEFDKYAIKSYNAIHHTNFETSDITKIHGESLGIVDTDKYDYIMTYSFCCQDLSLAGKRKGMKKGSGTRSGLLWEVERLLYECKNLSEIDSKYGLPQVLLLENVPQVHSDANMQDFEDWIESLNNLGYQSFYKDLNARNYGVAQNRDRCFMFSFLTNEYLDYQFPKEMELNKSIDDYLEDKVDDKYYLKNEAAKKLIEDLFELDLLPTEQNRTEQNRTEQNRTEQNRTEQNRTAYRCIDLTSSGSSEYTKWSPTICARYNAGIIRHKRENIGLIELWN